MELKLIEKICNVFYFLLKNLIEFKKKQSRQSGKVGKAYKSSKYYLAKRKL